MKVVLLQDVKAQGKKDQVVEVSDGYARNFLFPKKLAVPADAKVINDIKNKQSSAKHKEEVERENARALAKKLSETTIKLTAEAGSDGRFYGAITSKDIAEALKAQAGVEADKRKILLDAPIKAFGTYKIELKIYADISGKFNVTVTEK
jgi:large subunit ribosomal protein L9